MGLVANLSFASLSISQPKCIFDVFFNFLVVFVVRRVDACVQFQLLLPVLIFNVSAKVQVSQSESPPTAPRIHSTHTMSPFTTAKLMIT